MRKLDPHYIVGYLQQAGRDVTGIGCTAEECKTLGDGFDTLKQAKPAINRNTTHDFTRHGY